VLCSVWVPLPGFYLLKVWLVERHSVSVPLPGFYLLKAEIFPEMNAAEKMFQSRCQDPIC